MEAQITRFFDSLRPWCDVADIMAFEHSMIS